MNYAFSESALRSAEDFLHSNVDRWIELLGQLEKDGEWTKTLNMCEWVNWLVFDILGDLCFGKSFDMKEPNSDMKHVPEMMISFLELIHPVSLTHTHQGPRAELRRLRGVHGARYGCG